MTVATCRALMRIRDDPEKNVLGSCLSGSDELGHTQDCEHMGDHAHFTDGDTDSQWDELPSGILSRGG